MSKEELKRNLERAGCKVLEENDNTIIASCKAINFDVPEDVRTERMSGNNVRFKFQNDEE